MRWQNRRQSSNVQDRRGKGGMIAGGGASILIVALVVWLLGGNPTGVLSLAPSGGGMSASEEDEAKAFVAVVLADTEDVWNRQFAELGQRYREPELVLFKGQVSSACGLASSAVGPFYCPGDHQVYIDLDFFHDLEQRFGATGDFARAYVIAHEVGHHVQNLLGTMDDIRQRQQGLSEAEANALSVRLELQADFLAGVWAHHAQKLSNVLEPGDIEEALRAAASVGDDRIQQRQRGHVAPETFTHGTAAQRAYWFRRGFETGDLSQGLIDDINR